MIGVRMEFGFNDRGFRWDLQCCIVWFEDKEFLLKIVVEYFKVEFLKCFKDECGLDGKCWVLLVFSIIVKCLKKYGN